MQSLVDFQFIMLKRSLEFSVSNKNVSTYGLGYVDFLECKYAKINCINV